MLGRAVPGAVYCCDTVKKSNEDDRGNLHDYGFFTMPTVAARWCRATDTVLSRSYFGGLLNHDNKTLLAELGDCTSMSSMGAGVTAQGEALDCAPRAAYRLA